MKSNYGVSTSVTFAGECDENGENEELSADDDEAGSDDEGNSEAEAPLPEEDDIVSIPV